VVIHCLPGLYGPKKEPGVEHDPLSGLPWNGETFPLSVPGRVSIQGTSALDTIFDARGYDPDIRTALNQNIFFFGEAVSTGDPEEDFHRTFIDSIAMRGCRFLGAQSGSAIRIDYEAPVKVRISNCFIYGNDVGVALWTVV